MGMYTGLRFRGYVKPQYRQMIKEIMEDTSNWEDRKSWEDYTSQFPFLEKFATLPRSGMIPSGSLSYMPDEWEDENNILTSSFKSQFDIETGYWAFQCSLKNYDSEINVFIDEIIPVICESVDHVEELYEEWSSSYVYELINGVMVDTSKITYYDSLYKYDSWGGNNE